MPENRGQLVGRGVIGGAAEEPPIPTLAELGIDKKLSVRAQKLAAVPGEERQREFTIEVLDAEVVEAGRVVEAGAGRDAKPEGAES